MLVKIFCDFKAMSVNKAYIVSGNYGVKKIITRDASEDIEELTLQYNQVRKAYLGQKRHMYKNPEYAKWQNRIRKIAKKEMNGRDPYSSSNLVLRIHHCYKDKRNRDCDGPLKGIMDAIEKEFYVNDKQVKKVIITIEERAEYEGIHIALHREKGKEELKQKTLT